MTKYRPLRVTMAAFEEIMDLHERMKVVATEIVSLRSLAKAGERPEVIKPVLEPLMAQMAALAKEHELLTEKYGLPWDSERPDIVQP